MSKFGGLMSQEVDALLLVLMMCVLVVSSLGLNICKMNSLIHLGNLNSLFDNKILIRTGGRKVIGGPIPFNL